MLQDQPQNQPCEPSPQEETPVLCTSEVGKQEDTSINSEEESFFGVDIVAILGGGVAGVLASVTLVLVLLEAFVRIGVPGSGILRWGAEIVDFLFGVILTCCFMFIRSKKFAERTLFENVFVVTFSLVIFGAFSCCSINEFMGDVILKK
jgi:hypothetical protein